MSTPEQNKAAIHTLLKGIETGDPKAAAVVNEAKYIQHNPQTAEGSEGLAALFARLAKSNPRVNLVRVFADGDFVFGHTEYDFSTRRIGFEIFRFEEGRAVEHWDNIQPRLGPNASGRSMVDGPSAAVDLEKTQENRALVQDFVQTVFVQRHLERIGEFVVDALVQHQPDLVDGRGALKAWLEQESDAGPRFLYAKNHHTLAEGNFVLSANEGSLDGTHSALYDLFRIEAGRIVEHWGTREHIAPRSEWKNQNGKF